MRNAEEKWGSGIVEQVSLDLQSEFPGSKGFSTTNLWYMKQWYQFYSTAIPKLQQLDGVFQTPDSQPGTKLQQLVGELLHAEDSPDQGMDLPELFMCVPWGITFKYCPSVRVSKRPSSILFAVPLKDGAARL